MQRLQITGGTYTFVPTWIGHVLYGVPRYTGISIRRRLIGYDVHFPHAVGGNSIDSKNVWYFPELHCHLLDPLLRKDKPHFTLVDSFIHKGTKVWAKVKESEPSCTGCSFHAVPCMHKTPPCSAGHRHDSKHVILITAVEKW